MPEPSHAQQMIAALEAFLATNVGVGQITVDGQSVRFERAQAIAELERWKRKAEAKTSKVATMNLGSAW